jgi:hypothetical protein
MSERQSALDWAGGEGPWEWWGVRSRNRQLTARLLISTILCSGRALRARRGSAFIRALGPQSPVLELREGLYGACDPTDAADSLAHSHSTRGCSALRQFETNRTMGAAPAWITPEGGNVKVPTTTRSVRGRARIYVVSAVSDTGRCRRSERSIESRSVWISGHRRNR